MSGQPQSERGAIGFAEKLLQLLDEGQFTATYKYAVLLGLLDLCLENVSAKGVAPSVLTTRQLAEKTVALYWPHTLPTQARQVFCDRTRVEPARRPRSWRRSRGFARA